MRWKRTAITLSALFAASALGQVVNAQEAAE
ncbi:MAG: hypothetical protein RJA81_1052, partial [Planctomycetota bacterium]